MATVMFGHLLIVATLTIIKIEQVSTTRNQTFDGIFWEVKPYIFFDHQQQRFSGIYPTIFSKGSFYCNQVNGTVSLNINLKTREQFYNTITSNQTEGEDGGLLSNASAPGNSLWFPFDADKMTIGPYIFLNRNLSVLVGVTSKGLAVIFPRSVIWLPNKIVRGVYACRLILALAIVLSLSFGLALWVLERGHNPTFAKAGGPMTGLYWSLVTMTTVGYGDVVPVTFFGRYLSVIWMFIGLMVASVLTATLTDVVSGVSGLEINNQRVGVLRQSHEARFAEEDYFAIPVLYDSYDDVIKAVRNQEVYAGVLPNDVAAWMRNDFSNPKRDQPLEIVYELDGMVPFDLLVPQHIFFGSDSILNCMFTRYSNEVVTSTLDMYRKKMVKNIVYYGDLSDILEIVYIRIALITGLSAFALSICVSVYNEFKKRKNKVMNESDKREKLTKIFEDISLLMAEYKILTQNDDGNKLKERAVVLT